MIRLINVKNVCASNMMDSKHSYSKQTAGSASLIKYACCLLAGTINSIISTHQSYKSYKLSKFRF